MANRLYVANVPFAATNESLSQHFAQAGAVIDVQIMLDKFTGRSRGLAFVTMAGDGEAQNAISMLHGQPFEGRPLTVSEARPREERVPGSPRRSFGGGGGDGPGGGERRRFDRGERQRERERGHRGERRERRELGGGSRRFSPEDLDDGAE